MCRSRLPHPEHMAQPPPPPPLYLFHNAAHTRSLIPLPIGDMLFPPDFEDSAATVSLKASQPAFNLTNIVLT